MLLTALCQDTRDGALELKYLRVCAGEEAEKISGKHRGYTKNVRISCAPSGGGESG